MSDLDLSLLVLPGTIPGLLRKCSPVVNLVEFFARSGVYFEIGARVPLSRATTVEEHTPDAWEDEGHVCIEQNRRPSHTVALDLTNATGRNHAAGWLGSTRGRPDGMAADLRRNFSSSPVSLLVWAPGWQSASWDCDEVPALADLDPNDDRRLPDGSRWVDAEALRLVCLHVHAVNEASR